LHNLRTLGAQSPPAQARIARQSMELLAPFADRLGLYRLKREMEDPAVRYLDPHRYQDLLAAAVSARPHRAGSVARGTPRAEAALREEGLRATVPPRPRHLYSLFQRANPDGRGLSPGRLCRLVIVVDGSERDCWIALGVTHQLFPPIPGRLRD